MNQEEFIQVLRETLTGEISSQELESNINYYRTYIIEEIRIGKTEEEVLDALGEPRLIARTIINTQGFADQRTEQAGWRQEDSRQQSDHYNEQDGGHSYRRSSGSSGWLFRILVILIPILIIVGIPLILSGLIALVAPFLPFLIIVFIIKLMNNGRR